MGAVDTTYTFTATDTITSAKMNNIIDQTTITSDAIIGTTLEVASGKLKIRSAGITSNELATNAVTTTAINDGAVTPAKLSTAGPSWDSAGGTFILSQSAIELGYGITSNTASFIDFHSVHPLTDYDTRIVRYTGVDGWFAIVNQGSGGISFSSAGGFQFASAPMPNPSGTAPIYGARAWANIAISPTRSVASQANVASATKIDTTHTQIVFTTNMPDDVYVVTGCAKNDASLDFSTYDHQTTGFKIRHSTETSGRFVQFIVMR
ncbi:MAG: hypothetical protein RL000_1725 [Bacteroidota bacterium]|jgi:hypothetical protein